MSAKNSEYNDNELAVLFAVGIIPTARCRRRRGGALIGTILNRNESLLLHLLLDGSGGDLVTTLTCHPPIPTP